MRFEQLWAWASFFPTRVSSLMYYVFYCVIVCECRKCAPSVTCVIMQKSGAPLHTAATCFWDTKTDGKEEEEEIYFRRIFIYILSFYVYILSEIFYTYFLLFFKKRLLSNFCGKEEIIYFWGYYQTFESKLQTGIFRIHIFQFILIHLFKYYFFSIFWYDND